jgi:hypothetical protein
MLNVTFVTVFTYLINGLDAAFMLYKCQWKCQGWETVIALIIVKFANLANFGIVRTSIESFFIQATTMTFNQQWEFGQLQTFVHNWFLTCFAMPLFCYNCYQIVLFLFFLKLWHTRSSHQYTCRAYNPLRQVMIKKTLPPCLFGWLFCSTTSEKNEGKKICHSSRSLST